MNNRTAIITGAGKGIGRAIALKFAREGINLALFTRTGSDFDSLKPELDRYGVEYITFSGDVSRETDVDRFAAAVKVRFPVVDYLINNAGIITRGNLVDSTTDDFDRVMAVNVRGSYLMIRAFVGDMLRHQDGVIVFISSIAGLSGFAGGSIYAASKFAIQGLAESLMFEVRKSNVRVVTICPGYVRTDMYSSDSDPKPLPETITQPEDVAEAVYFACTMPSNTMIRQIEIRSTNPRMPGK